MQDRTSQVVAQELAQLRAALTTEMNKLPQAVVAQGQAPAPNTRQAITEKFTQALKEQSKISHGNLIKHMEKQHETIQKELIAQANIQNQNNKALFTNTLANYFNKRLELARIKLDECLQADKHTKKAQQYINLNYRTPEGKSGEEVFQELGGKHSHIVPAEDNNKVLRALHIKPTRNITHENGELSSESPIDLAKAAKSLKKDPFKFNKGKKTFGGARRIINSTEEMLRIGIKVSLDDKLMERMLSRPQTWGHSSGDYAAQLANFIKSPGLNVGDHQKTKLRQLNRICKASTAAYNNIKANPVFDANGDLKAGNETSTLGHQAETFMRLTTVKDRVAYLKILFPKNTQRYYAAFTKELERRGKTFYVDGQILTPTDYFKQELLWRTSRSKYQTQVDLNKDFDRFNGYDFALKTQSLVDNPNNAQSGKIYIANDGSYCVRDPNGIVRQGTLTPEIPAPIADLANKLNDDAFKAEVLDITAARGHTLNGACASENDRKTFYSNISDDKLVRRLAKTSFISDNQKRREFVTAAYDNLTEANSKHFINRTLPLVSRLSVNDANNQVDLSASLNAKSTLLDALRDKAETTFANEKAAQDPNAFNHFLKNKAHLDELEEKMAQEHQQKVLQSQMQDLMQREQRQPTTDEQNNALPAIKRDIMMRRRETLRNAANPEQQAERFVKRLSPALQQQVWAGMDPAEPSTLELRALALKQFMDLHNESDSPAAATFLKDSMKPLIARLDDPQKTTLMARVAELCQNGPKPFQGCDSRENRALHALRDLVPTPAAEPLLSTRLFAAYYHRVDNNGGVNNNNNAQETPAEKAAKLLKRIQCYVNDKPSNRVAAWRHHQKFDAEMRTLLLPGNAQNLQIMEIIAALKQDAAPLQGRQGAAVRDLIKRIEPLQPNFGQAPKQQPANVGADDVELESLDEDTADSSASRTDIEQVTPNL